VKEVRGCFSAQALERPPPPEFPLNPALLTGCRARVRLAVRLDAILRARSKAAAENAWLCRNAAAVGVDAGSDDEGSSGDSDAPNAELSPRSRAATAVAAAAATADNRSAAKIQQVHTTPVSSHKRSAVGKCIRGNVKMREAHALTVSGISVSQAQCNKQHLEQKGCMQSSEREIL
jgi:hypothetical protein